MKDPCRKSTRVKVLRNAVEIRTGKPTRLSKKKLCEVFTNIQEKKLPLPPLILSPDRTYLIDRKSPLTSNDYERLFDASSSRATLKRLAEKVNIKKVEGLTKSQLIEAILKRLSFLKIFEPVKLGKRSSAVCKITAAKPSVPAAVKPPTPVVVKPPAAAKPPTPVVVKPPAAANVKTNVKASVSENNAKVILGDRNYNLLFDPTTKKEELVRIAKKVGIVDPENMTKREIVEAVTKRIRFMSNRGLTPRTMKSGTKVPFFPVANGKPPPTTFPSFLQPKPQPAFRPTPVPGSNSFRPTPVPIPGLIPPRPPKPSTTNAGTSTNNRPSNTITGPTNSTVKPPKPGSTGWKPSFPKLPKLPKLPKWSWWGSGGKKPKPSTTGNAIGTNVANVANGGIGGNTLPPVSVTLNSGTGNNGPVFNSGTGNNTRLITKNITNAILDELKKDVVANINRAPIKKKKTNSAIVEDLILNEVINDIINEMKQNNTKKRFNSLVTPELIGQVTNDVFNALRNNIGKTINTVPITNKLVGQVTNDVFNELRKNVNTKKRTVNINTNSLSNEITKKVVNEAVNNVPISKKKNITKLLNSIEVQVKKLAKKNDNEIIDKLTNEILDDITKDVQSNINRKPINKMKSNKPIYNTNSNSNNNGNIKPIYNTDSNNNNNKKTKTNNPLFEPNMKANPLFNTNNGFNGGLRLGANNNNVSIPKNVNKNNRELTELKNYVNKLGLNAANRNKIVKLFNTTNQTLNNAKKGANIISNTRKRETNNSFSTKRKNLENKIRKVINSRPTNNGGFKERGGLAKGRIGFWANALREAKTNANLKDIENALNKKVELRKNIENKYTKMGLTNKSVKNKHRNMVIKYRNNVNNRRKEIENYLSKKPTLMDRSSYQSKINGLQRRFPRGLNNTAKKNWISRSKGYTRQIQSATKYGDMIRIYNNAMKNFKNLR